MATSAVKRESAKDSLAEWMRLLPESVELSVSSSGSPYVRARKDIPKGWRFGPYLEKWHYDDCNPTNSEVSTYIYTPVALFAPLLRV